MPGNLYNLKAGAATPLQLASGFGPLTGMTIGNEYWVDPVHGNNANSGTSPDNAFKSVATAFAATTGDQNDVIYFIPGDTADSLTAGITWNKDYVHLIGLGAPFPGIGQRSRITSTVTAPALTISAHGCYFANIQVQNSYAGASGGVLVSGPYNYFENFYFNGINHATAAANASSYCLTVSGAENLFNKCTIGSVQIAMSSTNAPLIVSNGANTWVDCRIQHYSETAGNFLVKVITGAGSLLLFDRCIFFNQAVNWAAGSTDVFNISVATSHYVLLRDEIMIGATAWADTVTHVYHSSAAPATGGGIAIAVNA